APTAADTDAPVGFLPGSAFGTAALPHTCQIRLPVRGAGDRTRGRRLGGGRAALRRGLRRQEHRAQSHCDNQDGGYRHEHAHHGTSTAGLVPPSPVPAGGPKNSFLPPGKVISRECAQLPPSRARHPKTVILSPGLRLTSFFHPILCSTAGL